MAHNWLTVYKYFIATENSTYNDLSEKFNIPVSTIKERASMEKWQEKREQVIQAALNLLERRTAEEIAKRKEEHIKLARVLQGLAIEALTDKEHPIKPESFEDIRRCIATGIKIERLALNMDKPIDQRITIANNQVQELEIRWGDGAPLDAY